MTDWYPRIIREFEDENEEPMIYGGKENEWRQI